MWLNMVASTFLLGPAPISDPGEWRGKVVPNHPRILITTAQIDEIKKLIEHDDGARSLYQRLRQQAEGVLNEPVSTYEIPDGLRLLSTSRQVLDRVYLLGLLYLLDRRREYKDRLWAELESAAAFPDWNPRHFLDTAEMAHAFGIAYDWLYQDWTEEQRQVLRQAMVEKAFNPGLAAYKGESPFGWWVTANHNWNQVCNGGLSVAALALLHEVPSLPEEILTRALHSLPMAMNEFYPDGAWQEGPGYWNYATKYNCVSIAAIISATGSDLGLLETPGFSVTGHFPIYMTSPTGNNFNFGDAWEGILRAPQLLWLAKVFKEPAYAYYQKLRARSPLDLIWWTTEGHSPEQSGWALDRYFRKTEVVVFRSRWDDPNAFYIGFKAGDNRANHSHLDLGSFILEALGIRWAIDLGADDYNLPGYFGRQRWDYYRLRAEGHNTIVIGEGPDTDQDPKAFAPIVRFVSEPNRSFAIADLTAAYKGKAVSVRRGLAMVERSYAVIQDEFRLSNDHPVWWFLHTRAAISLSEDGRRATLTEGQKSVVVVIDEPVGASFQVMKAEPLPSSPRPAGQNSNDGIQKIAICWKGAKEGLISVRVHPVWSKRAGIPSKVAVKPLNDW